jgi:hypothetical protein
VLVDEHDAASFISAVCRADRPIRVLAIPESDQYPSATSPKQDHGSAVQSIIRTVKGGYFSTQRSPRTIRPRDDGMSSSRKHDRFLSQELAGKMVRVRTRLRCQGKRRRQQAGILKWQVSSHTPGRTVGIPLLRTVSTPLLPSPSVPVRGFRALRTRRSRTHSGRRRPGIAPRSASALVSGGWLGWSERAVKPSARSGGRDPLNRLADPIQVTDSPCAASWWGHFPPTRAVIGRKGVPLRQPEAARSRAGAGAA